MSQSLENDIEVNSRTLEIINNLEMIPDLVAQARHSGIHSSSDHGGNVEFAEHRQYEPGDDLRHLDWNALAKTDDLFLKQYESDTRITSRLFLDASKSMDYASHEVSKWDTARALGVLVASTLLNQQDRVACTISGDHRWETGTIGRLGDLNNHLDRLQITSANGPTTLTNDLRETPVDQRSLWLVISDFWVDDPEQLFQWFRGLKERGHDAVFMAVWDPVERYLDVEDAVELTDVETGDSIHVGPDNLDRFQKALEQWRNNLTSMAESAGFEFWPFYTDEDLYQRYRKRVLNALN